MKKTICFTRLFVSDTLIRKYVKPAILIAYLFSLILSTSINAAESQSNSLLPPVAQCKNITVQLGTDGTVTITGSDINSGSYDPDGTIVNLMVSPNTFDCSGIGPNTVTLTVTDNEGLNSVCNATVNVEDKTAPVVNVRPFELVLNSMGTGTLLPSDIDNGTFDNCGNVTLSVSQSAFTCSDLGIKTITLTATDANGNSSSRATLVTVSSTLEITGISLSSCDLSPSLALFKATIEGGNGTYSYLWKGIEETAKPFMVIIPFPPSLQFYNTSTLEKPFFNNTLANGIYHIRFVATDGNGCRDTSEISIRNTGFVFNNMTMKNSEACEGEVRTYSVNNEPDATYLWSVVNGTILTADQDTNKIDVRWNIGAFQGVVTATLQEPNTFFPAGQCESSVVDSVTLWPAPVPVFNNPALNVCSESENIYTLTNTYSFFLWTVTGGFITGGGNATDNFVQVRWGAGPTGSITVSAGSNSSCTGSALINISVFNLSGSITSRTDITCNGGTDGTVTALASAGTGQSPYSYSLDGGAWQAGGTFTGLMTGNHIVTIRDALLCTFELPFIINQPMPVSGAIQTKTDVTCFGGNDGSVTISASGGTPPYQYSINGGAYQNQNIFSGLPAGSHTVSIRDSHNCTTTVSVLITQPSAILNGTVAVTNVNCFGALTGRVNLTVTGGTIPYTFIWSNGATTEDLLNVGAGNYSVVIRDGSGCTVTVPASVTQPAVALSGTTTVVNILCFGSTTGAVNLSVAGGIAPYTFLWTNGATTEDIANLPAGNYSVTISDANGCTATSAGTVSGPAAAVGGSITAQNNVLCKGGSNGSVTIAGSGGVGPYSYRLGAGSYQASGTFGSLTAGTYTINIRDANLCTFNLPVNITEPLAQLSGSITSQTNISCFGASTGRITAGALGGTSPYQYNIDGGPFQSSATFINLAAGAHNVIIRDKNLCIVSLPVSLSQPASQLSGSVVSQVNVNCFGATTGSVTVSGSGGTSPYTFAIDAGIFQATGLFNNLGAGVHNVIVRDQNLCQFNIPVTLTQPASALAVTTSRTNVLCFGGSTGSATATASGGTAPYTYSWNTVPVQSTPFASGLSAQTYTVTVTDHSGCITSSNVSITQPAGPFTANAVVDNVTCFGGSTGSINLTTLNGLSPISYLWNNGATSEDLNGIPVGTYTVTVTDGNGCEAGATGTVGQPAQLSGNIVVTNSACFGGSTGSCILTVTGGTLPYTFLWNNGAVTEDITGISAGNYFVTVTDAHSCTINVNGTVTQPASALTLTIVSQTDVTVYGGSDGSATVSGSGGTPPYSYSLNGGSYQATGVFVSLAAGTHKITLRDANMCTVDINVTITQPMIPLSLNIVSQTDVACNGGTTGAITAAAWGGLTPYEYRINGGAWQSSGTFGSLQAGSYTLAVRDASSASFDMAVTLTEPPELALSSTTTIASCPDTDDGAIDLTITGGTGTYNIIWSDGAATQNLTGIIPGTYSVVVTDQNLCAKSLQAEVGFTGTFNCLVIPQLITPDNNGHNDEWVIRNIDIYPEAEIRVYNRWGKLVFKTRNLSAEPWDGRYNGKLVPTDSYHYILYLNDGSAPRSGVISVIR